MRKILLNQVRLASVRLSDHAYMYVGIFIYTLNFFVRLPDKNDEGIWKANRRQDIHISAFILI